MPTVRWMIKGDFRAVLEIERQSFDEPWTENDFVQSLQNKNHRGTAMGMVHETVADDGLIKVDGFMVYILEPGAIRLINLAVAPESRRNGVGRALLDRLRGKLAGARRRKCVTAVVRETNLDAHLWFRACGWEAIKVIRLDEWGEDGIVFVARAKSPARIPIT
jgi:ribosomal-protein-alanine N-acetyltransferase